MKRAMTLALIILSLTVVALAQGGTTSANILPASTGQTLGNDNARWTVYAYDIDVQGKLTIANPTADTDAASKGYVDSAIGAVSSAVTDLGATFRHKRAASCVTTGAQWAGCALAGHVTWDAPFSDASYTVTCTLVGPNAPGFVTHIADQQAGYVAVQILAATAVATSGTLDCIAIHE